MLLCKEVNPSSFMRTFHPKDSLGAHVSSGQSSNVHELPMNAFIWIPNPSLFRALIVKALVIYLHTVTHAVPLVDH